jgi:glutamine synthetase adenylyltransferase
MQMRANLWQPNWNAAVDSLRSQGKLSESETTDLKAAYDLLRRCESVLRRQENTTLSSLPADPRDLARFCRRMGFETVDALKLAYEGARSLIHKIYAARFRNPITGDAATPPVPSEQKS